MATSSRASPGLDGARPHPHGRDRDVPDRRSISRSRSSPAYAKEAPRHHGLLERPEEIKRIRALISDVEPARDQSASRSSSRVRSKEPSIKTSPATPRSTKDVQEWRENCRAAVRKLRDNVLQDKSPNAQRGAGPSPPPEEIIAATIRRTHSIDFSPKSSFPSFPYRTSNPQAGFLRPNPIPERSCQSCRSVSRLRGGSYPAAAGGTHTASVVDREVARDSADLKLAYRRSASRRAERPRAMSTLRGVSILEGPSSPLQPVAHGRYPTARAPSAVVTRPQSAAAMKPLPPMPRIAPNSPRPQKKTAAAAVASS